MYGIDNIDDWDYWMGTEQQNAFALSCMERQPDDTARCIEAVEQGKFVVVLTVPEHCPRTDAVMGSRVVFVSAHDTKDEAEAEMTKVDHSDGDYSYDIWPIPQPRYQEPVILPSDDIPF